MAEVIDNPDEESSGETSKPSHSRLMRGLAVVPLVLLVVVAGRAWLAEDEAEPSILSVSGGPGPVAFADVTRADEYWGTFGTYLLCVNEDVDDLELTGFRYESTIKPRDLYVGVRTITPGQVAKATQDREGFAPIRSQRGRPLEFVDRGRSLPRPGTYQRGINGVAVTTDCADTSAFGTRAMTAPMQELLITAQTGPQGAYITNLELDYEADGESHTLRLETDLAFCGTRVTICAAT